MNRFFDPQTFVPAELRRDELPAAKEAYETALKLAWPAVIEMVLLSVIGAADTMMVGKLGHAAIAAVGLSGQPRLLFVGTITALNTGTIALVSRRKGQDDQAGACRVLAQALAINFVLGVVMAYVAISRSEFLMKLAGANEETLALSSTYFRIVFYGFVLQTIALTISAAQRGIGNTHLTMRLNVTANLVNVVFNYFLIYGHFGFPRLEVAGAAAATALGYSVAAVLAIFTLFKKDGYLNLSGFRHFTFDPSIGRSMLQVGGNAILEQWGMRFGFFMYSRIVASLGTIAYATHQIGSQLLTITFTVGDGLAVAATALTGQNLGKKRPDLSLMYITVLQRIAMVASLGLLVLIIAARTPIAGLFIDDANTIRNAGNLFIIIALVQPLQTSNVVMSGSLRGAGDTRYVAFVMLTSILILRVGGGWLLTYPAGFGLYGCWLALCVDQFYRYAMFWPRLKKGKWMHFVL
ncbi:MAG TPA: MATE family efflux transporter [Candidatus Acidoferrum sp.]|nr:MATE family efflux transporter [Candidatus Acidoferrum sp.]